VHSVSGIELANALATHGEEALRILWTRARDTAPSIILIVDLDALASRGSSYDHLVPFMDELDPSEKVIVVATTEKPEGLDPALLRPGRFEKVVFIPPPDLAARQKILSDGLRGVPLDGNVDVARLARLTDGYSGENLVMAVNEAKLSRLKDVTGEETGVAVSQADIEGALNKIAPSVKPEVVEACMRFAGAAPISNGNGQAPEALLLEALSDPEKVAAPRADATTQRQAGQFDALIDKIKDIHKEDR
jgi:transitional endoplasmic reticulum ATPase